jgi:meso-butanediol dehydrogenase / (S,S)-butanediol dehydrogenase / diacetyl reductase
MLEPEVAFVTGAASGVGRSVANRLAARGALVALIDSNAEGARKVEQEINEKGGASHAFAADVTNSDSVQQTVSEAVALMGSISTVVSCAGILRIGTVLTMPEQEWQDVIAVNLNGTFLVARHTMPWLLKSRGAFVAISSDAGTQGASGYAAYCASKHGVLGLVRCLALDHGPQGVRSNAICPSFVQTPMVDAAFVGATAEQRQHYEQLVPLGRFARPEEIASMAAYLTSAEASYVNGAVYAVDGGATAGYFVR